MDKKKNPDPKENENRERAKAGRNALKRLGGPIKGRIFWAQVLTILSGILSIAPYVALTKLGALLIQAHNSGVMDTERIWKVGKFLAMSFSLQLSLYLIALLITHFADLKLRDILRRDIVNRMAKAPLSWFSASNSGAIRKAVQDDTAAAHTIIAHAPVDKLNAIVQPLALLCYAFFMDYRLGLLSLATIPIYIISYSFTMRGMAEKTAQMNTYLEKVSSSMVEFVSGIKVVKTFGQSGKAHGKYIEAADAFSKFYLGWCIPLVSITCFAMAWISEPLLLFVNFLGGNMLTAANSVEPFQVVTAVLIAIAIPRTIYTVMTIEWSYQIAGAAGIRLCELMDLEILPETSDGKLPKDSSIEMEDVSFSYGATEALKKVSLKFEEGTVSALVGPSGSGKTTLATLIARFSDPSGGAVKIGSVDIREMTEEALYNKVSFVLQDAQLLNMSIEDNIKLGKENATHDEVVEAAKVAQIHELIESLPEGYATVLGSGRKLSGGEEQRLSIARAVLLNTPVLLLDEATAFADPESEADIQKALSLLVKGKTVLVIAHRPGAIRGADKIVVMERGEVAAEGKHEELSENKHYQSLLRQSTAKGAMA